MAYIEVGTAGRLTITDDGTRVRFSVSCTDGATRTGGYRWYGTVNGSPVGGTISLPAGFGSRLLGEWVVSKTQTVKLGQHATGTMGLGGAASFSTKIARPAPNAPSDLTITRVSDSQQTLNWSRHSTYTSVVVQRRTNGGSWQAVGTASGNAYTFTDKTTAKDKKYEYRVAGVAASGQSEWSNIDTVYTTPAVPTGIKAARSGNNIVVSATATSSIASGFDVRDGSSVIAENVSLPYTHVAPDAAVPHTYTARAVRTSPDALASAWSPASNTVQLLTKPNAPTNLKPNGAVWPSDTDVLFSWSHNAVDSSPQSEFELHYRRDGGAWTTITGTTSSQASAAVDVAAVEWQVRTKGAHPDWSDWSAVASFTVIDRPGVAVVQPAGTWDASILVPEWTWFQAQGRPQSAWQVELLDAGNNVVESRNGSGATTALQLNTRLTEGVWTLRARGATGEVWSLLATETFTVAFTPPGAPVLYGEWDELQGGVQIAVSGEEYGGAVLVDGVWYARIGE